MFLNKAYKIKLCHTLSEPSISNRGIMYLYSIVLNRLVLWIFNDCTSTIGKLDRDLVNSKEHSLVKYS